MLGLFDKIKSLLRIKDDTENKTEIIAKEENATKNESDADNSILDITSVSPESPKVDNLVEPAEEQPLKTSHTNELERLKYYQELSKQNELEIDDLREGLE